MPIPWTTAQLPTGANFGITTVEELNTWTTLVLQFNYAAFGYTEAANTNPLFHYMQPQLRIPDGKLIYVNRCAIIANEAAAQNLPLWKRVRGLEAVTTIADGFRIAG